MDNIAEIIDPGIEIQSLPEVMEEMHQSPTMAKLAEALAKAQLDFTPIKKDVYNKYYDSYYSDLGSVIDATRPALAKNGIVIMQFPQVNTERQNLTLTSKMFHSSGEWIESILTLPATMKAKEGGIRFDSQSVGSAMTYARRYSWQGLTGCTGEIDDDANTASGNGNGNGAPANGTKEAAQAVAQQKIAEHKAKQAETATDAPPDIPVGVQCVIKKSKTMKNKAGNPYRVLETLGVNDEAIVLYCFDNRKYPDGSELFGMLDIASVGRGQVAKFVVSKAKQWWTIVRPMQIGSVQFDDDGVPIVDRQPGFAA